MELKDRYPARLEVHAAPRQAPAAKTHQLLTEGNPTLGIISLLVLAALWQLGASLGAFDPLFFSSPAGIVRAFIKWSQGTLLADLETTMAAFFLGFVLSAVFGIVVGVLVGWYLSVRLALQLLITALYNMPRIALIPLLILWFGIGIGSKVALAFLTATLPILINTAAGMRTVDPMLIRVARTFGAKDRDILIGVCLPATVPFIATGLRLGVGFAFLAVVVGELFASTSGIGHKIAASGQLLQTDEMFAAVLLIAALGIILTEILIRVERSFQRWRPVDSEAVRFGQASQANAEAAD